MGVMLCGQFVGIGHVSSTDIKALRVQAPSGQRAQQGHQPPGARIHEVERFLGATIAQTQSFPTMANF